jgi:hypothetical protein
MCANDSSYKITLWNVIFRHFYDVQFFTSPQLRWKIQNISEIFQMAQGSNLGWGLGISPRFDSGIFLIGRSGSRIVHGMWNREREGVGPGLTYDVRVGLARYCPRVGSSVDPEARDTRWEREAQNWSQLGNRSCEVAWRSIGGALGSVLGLSSVRSGISSRGSCIGLGLGNRFWELDVGLGARDRPCASVLVIGLISSSAISISWVTWNRERMTLLSPLRHHRKFKKTSS